jgi:hypothetical protein
VDCRVKPGNDRALSECVAEGEHRLAMVEALVDEIDYPDTGLVSRDFLRAELQTLRTELQTLRANLIGTIWRVVLTAFGIQVVLVGTLVATLVGRGSDKGVTRTAMPGSVDHPSRIEV